MKQFHNTSANKYVTSGPYLNSDWIVRPIWPAKKAIKGSRRRIGTEDEAGRKKLDQMPLLELRGRKSEYWPFDLGICLPENNLLLVEGDIKRIGENSIGEPMFTDGPLAIEAWREEHPGALPETWSDQSPGRPDGTHRSGGIHLLYEQNPDKPITGHWELADGIEVQACGIVRVRLTGGGPKALTHMPPVQVPLGTRALLIADRVAANGNGGRGGASGPGDCTIPLDRIDPKTKVAGTNRSYYLCRWKGLWCAMGLPEVVANELARLKNAELGEPYTEHELQMVLMHKEWDWAVPPFWSVTERTFARLLETVQDAEQLAVAACRCAVSTYDRARAWRSLYHAGIASGLTETSTRAILQSAGLEAVC